MLFADTLTPSSLITQASFEWMPTTGICLAVIWYLWAVHRLKQKGRVWPVQRTISFLWANFALTLALLSGLSAFDDTSFTIHALQHILIGMLAPILLALSAPVTLLLQSSPRVVQTGVLKVIHSPVGKLLSNPLITWPLFGGTLFGFYFTSLYADSLTNNTLHQLIHLHMIVVGCLFYWPVIGIDPLPRRLNHGIKILYLMLALPFHTILGMALESQTTPIAPGISLSDLHNGGALMWVIGEAIGLIGTLSVFVQWLRVDERAARRADRVNEAANDRQLALWRAAREAAARSI